MASTLLRWLVRGFLGLLAALVLALLAGTIWEGRMRARALVEYPPPGQMVDLGTHRLHLRRLGSGPVTVILDAGTGNLGSFAWANIEQDLAAFATVVTYDRAGINWSEPGPSPRSTGRIADELRVALDKVGITGPVVLVGHSQGGVNMTHFALKYPHNVAGPVLIDASLPSSYQDIPAEARVLMVPPALVQAALPIAARTGLLRLVLPPGGAGLPEPMPEVDTVSVNAMLAAYFPQTEQHGFTPEFKDQATPAFEYQPQMLGDLPVRVLSSPYLPPQEVLGPAWSDALYRQVLEFWERTQERHLELSTNATRVKVPNSHHFISVSNPEVVVEAIRELAAAAETEQT